MRRNVQRWIVTVGVGVAAFAAGAGGAATGLAGAAVRAAGDCMPTDCGPNHNQVLA